MAERTPIEVIETAVDLSIMLMGEDSTVTLGMVKKMIKTAKGEA